jgi:hypothetical protein
MKLLAVLTVAGFALVGPAREARADLAIAFILNKDATTLQFYAVDNNVPVGYSPPAGYTQVLDVNPLPGVLELDPVAPALIPGYLVSGSVQTQTTAVLPGQFNALNSSALSITNDTGGTVTATVAVSGTNYKGPAFVANSSGSITWQNAIGSSISATWWDDPANAQGAEGATDLPGNQVFSWTDTASTLADSGSDSGSTAVSDGLQFSMSLGFVLTTIDPTSSALDGNAAVVVNRGQTELKQLAAVPEPSTVAMAGFMTLAGLGYSWRRRRAAA